jgi:hypothetical protein
MNNGPLHPDMANILQSTSPLKNWLTTFLNSHNKGVDRTLYKELQQFVNASNQSFKNFHLPETNEQFTQNLIAKCINKLKQNASSHSTAAMGAFTTLMSSMLSLYIGIALTLNEQTDQAKKYVSKSMDLYEKLEEYFYPYIDNEAAFNQVMRVVYQLHLQIKREMNPQYTSPQEIKKLIHLKNNESTKFNLPYHGKVIFNSQSLQMVTLDKTCTGSILNEIQKIQEKQQKRSQYVIFLSGVWGHVISLDINYNPKNSCIEIICVESAQQKTQWDFLKHLTLLLSSMNSRYQILACQAQLQKDVTRCALFSFVISSVLSKTHFQSLEPYVISGNFYDPSSNELELLPNTRWIPTAAFGEKLTKMAQSFSTLKASFTTDKYALFSAQYGFDETILKTYIDYREEILRGKINNTFFQGLTEATVLKKFDTTSMDQALRRSAAGFGQTRDMKYLLNLLKTNNRNDAINTADNKTNHYTPLHLAIIHKQEKRACLLVESGAKSNIPDSHNKTAAEYFAESHLKDNGYLKASI